MEKNDDDLTKEEDSQIVKGTTRRGFLSTMAKIAAGAGLIGSGAGIEALSGCAKAPTGTATVSAAVAKAIVPPGKWDKYYGFWSAGPSGEVRILGLPSMRTLLRIPVFNNDTGRGYGLTGDDQSEKMLQDAGGYYEGDTHHPPLSYTNSDYDGRYVYIDDKSSGRIARIRLDYFQTDAITALPNVSAVHGLATQRYPKTGYVFCASEFEVPMPNDGRDIAPTGNNAAQTKNYWTLLSAVDGETMEVKWQVLVDGNQDNMGTDYKGLYAFATCYNADKGWDVSTMTKPPVMWAVFVNISRVEAAVRAGKYKTIGKSPVPVLDGRHGSELTAYIPVEKDPHGISATPDGKYVVANGKLAPKVTVIDLEKVGEVFNGKIKPKDAVAAVLTVGIGPLHTVYDGRGNAYTTLFVDSQMVKWNIEEAIRAYNGDKKVKPIKQKLDVQYQPGHNMATQSSTIHPTGEWLVSLNKFSKDRFLPVGPRFPENDQLIDISGDKMILVYDNPVYIEPHQCEIALADRIKYAKKTYDPKYFANHIAAGTEGVKRIGPHRVIVRLTGVAPILTPVYFHVKEGDLVTVIYSNNDTVENLAHGFNMTLHGKNVNIDPGETKEITFTADRAGVYWYYCTIFCHALHLEMRGRMIVEKVPGYRSRPIKPNRLNGKPSLHERFKDFPEVGKA